MLFTLHLPLKPKGNSEAAQLYDMSIEVDVTAGACTSNSRVCIQNRALPATCSSSAGSTYTQGDELEVYVSDLQDINRLVIPSHAVDVSADMVLTFCRPHKRPPDCKTIPMIYTDGRFSAALPRLTHKGSHHITINHEHIAGCSSNATLVSSCKVGHTANKQFECMPAEEESTTTEQVCCCRTNVYTGMLECGLRAGDHEGVCWRGGYMNGSPAVPF